MKPYVLMLKKLDQKESNFRKKELQYVCKQWLKSEGTYSLENWSEFCKHCDIFVCIENNLIVGILLTSLASIYQCEQLDECLDAHNLPPNKTLHIMMFAVDPKYRQKGVGTQLFNLMYTQTDFQHVTYYILAMREQNVVAKKFYLKQGFVESGFKCDNLYEQPTDNQIMLIKTHNKV